MLCRFNCPTSWNTIIANYAPRSIRTLDKCAIFSNVHNPICCISGGRRSCKQRLDVIKARATKEQRALLFQKMKEAGYMWDADKKELKKISQEYPLTPDECIKPAWSEEDNGHVLIISDIIEDKKNEQLYQIGIKVLNKEIAWLKSLKDRFQPQPQKEWSEEDEEMLCSIINVFNGGLTSIPISKYTNWLKSLKDRVKPQWKPSDEQIEAIRIAGVVGTANDSWAMNILKDMYLQLNGL